MSDVERVAAVRGFLVSLVLTTAFWSAALLVGGCS